MRKLNDITYLNNCHECIHHLKDEHNPYRKYCGKFVETHGEPKEISVIHDFPVICPLEKI